MKEYDRGRLFCTLRIPNFEVKYIYEEIIRNWFRHTIYDDKLNLMLRSLKSGDIETFESIFQEFILNSLSSFDLGGDEPEKIYHVFVLGMLIYLSGEYELKSNRESGYGRYDIMLVPREGAAVPGIIMEFKKVNTHRHETLEAAADKALQQIADKAYRQELVARGVREILELGLAFLGKDVYIKSRQINEQYPGGE